MKRFFGNILAASLLFLALSCLEQPETDIDVPSVEDGWSYVNLNFGFNDFNEVKFETKSTLDKIPESRVSNLFVIIFVGNQRYYAHYFDALSRVDNNDSLEDEEEGWQVWNYTNNKPNPTRGTIRLRAPHCDNAEIYLIANIDTDMLNVSPEKLKMVTRKSDLMNMEVVLNQCITSRNGLFPMSGTVIDPKHPELGPRLTTITGQGIYLKDNPAGEVSIPLERIDSKVMVNVRVATDNEITEKGADGTTTVQTLKEFRPESWQVVNLPKGAHLARHEERDVECGYFSTDPVIFETMENKTFTYRKEDRDNPGSYKDTTVTSECHGFSFYTLESHKSELKHKSVYDEGGTDLEKFHRREKKVKDKDGKHPIDGDVWEYAPENAVYLVIKGEVIMDVDVSSEAKQQQLSADVTYYIHLGEINANGKKDYDSYTMHRNTLYSYTVTIRGVNAIELEVESSYDEQNQPAKPEDVQEKNPGAEGMVYIAKESVYTFDAHYGQRVFNFDADYIDANAVTWYVKTPFGKEGVPNKIGETEIPSGMDYKWVHMMLNNPAASKDYSWRGPDGKTSTATLTDLPFSSNNQPYPGDNSSKLMNIVEFVEYIKVQKRNLDAGKENDFRLEFDQDWFDWYNRNHKGHEVKDPGTPDDLVDGKMAPWFRYRIYTTVYVDEYYYEEDPITGERDPELWKRFVNQPNRLMHILCDNKKSLDGKSSSTGSVVTIRQRSIQTPYNITDPDLHSAWGCESEDENLDSYLFYYPTEKDNRDDKLAGEDSRIISFFNGLYNTARIWGAASPADGSWKDSIRWDTYLDYDRPNDYKSTKSQYNLMFLKEEYTGLKYSAMMRNRDNNGNGVIDPEEVRWYIAAIGQLEYLFLAELGLSEESKLYTRKHATPAKDDVYPGNHPYKGTPKWKYHYISSTMRNTGSKGWRPSVLWAEEGVSISAYKEWIGDEMGPYGIKCIRNLGTGTPTRESFKNDTDENTLPQMMIEVEKPTDSNITQESVYRFDCAAINSKSLRFKTTIELEPYDENTEMSRLYEGFETGPLVKATFGKNYKYLKEMLEAGNSPCPAGYRVPNIREVVTMCMFCDNKTWWVGNNGGYNSFRIYSSTYYSLGVLGNGKNPGKASAPRYSWNSVANLWPGDSNINLNGDQNSYIRCVRDWNPHTDK